MMLGGTIGAGTLWFATNSIPDTIEEADGILATNLQWLGWDDPPQFLATSAADNTLAIASFTFAVIGIFAFFSWIWDKFYMKKKKPISQSELSAPAIGVGPGASRIWIDECDFDGFEQPMQIDGQDVSVTNSKFNSPDMAKNRQFHVTSNNQSGGVTAGLYVNQAEPSVEQGRHSPWYERDGAFYKDLEMRVTNPGMVSKVRVTVIGRNLMGVGFLTEGMAMTGAGGSSEEAVWLELLSVPSMRGISIRAKEPTETDVQIHLE
ncbi:hypothetical protein [Alteraurantiacibacter aquimixticola]|uniref:Uncharacterized protein n=1 Tax=Alteraurantiacibacter aquimixticola TaxID=2489173 RepID=A0A4T3EYD0_9SPHN|nr:hypothetical protein [Alteraurantiacibacter aquimixticola]TIX49658.1 hypothetical protein E5222_12595 [Alteraurantiacibacter aquimixticola]